MVKFERVRYFFMRYCLNVVAPSRRNNKVSFCFCINGNTKWYFLSSQPKRDVNDGNYDHVFE